jgi:hypothetical protein
MANQTSGNQFRDYAVSIGIPVQVHWENGLSQWIFQYSFSFWEGKQSFSLSWEGFFHRIRFKLGASA